MRYIQRVNADGTSRFDPVGSSTVRTLQGAIHGAIQSFVSPVDGSVITDRNQLREHNKRNGVVNAEEFSQGHFDRAAEKRAQFFEGQHSSKEKLERKREIYESIIRAERG